MQPCVMPACSGPRTRDVSIYTGKGKKLVVDGTPITDDDGLLTCWRTNFETLAQSQTSKSESGVVSRARLSRGRRESGHTRIVKLCSVS